MIALRQAQGDKVKNDKLSRRIERETT